MKMYQRKTEKKRIGKQVLAWIMTLAMVLSLVMVPAGKVQAAENVDLTVSSAPQKVNEKGQVEIEIAAPNGYTSIQSLKDAGYTKLQVSYNIASYTQSDSGTAGIQPYYAYGDSWTYYTGGVWKNFSDGATGTITLDFSSSTTGISDELKRFGLQFCNVTGDISYNITSAKLISGSSSTGSGTESNEWGTTRENSTNVKAAISNQEEPTADWSGFDISLNNNTGSTICDWIIVLEMPTGAGANFQCWNSVYVADGDTIYLYPKNDGTNAVVSSGVLKDYVPGFGVGGKKIYANEINVKAVYYDIGSSSQYDYSSGSSNDTSSSGGSSGSGEIFDGNNIGTIDTSLDYNFAKLLQYSLYFYDANMCGDQVSETSLYSKDLYNGWRGDCHVNDKFTYNGQTYSAVGGFHDAGDHVKFGVPLAVSMTTLGLGYYEFGAAYDELGQTSHLKTITDYYCDYVRNCTVLNSSGEVEAFCYQVGSGQKDHESWCAPEVENESATNRTYTLVATSSNPATDVVSETAAALAINYLNFGNEEDLKYAKALFAFAMKYAGSIGATDSSGSFYGSSSWKDDFCLAAGLLYKATKDATYATAYNNNNGNSGNLQKPYGWDNVYHAAVLYAPTINESELNTMNSYFNSVASSSSSSYFCQDKWGSARINCNVQLMMMIYDKHNGTNTFQNWAKYQMSMILGNNSINKNLVCGYNTNSPTKPHHRAASGYSGWTEFNSNATQKYTLYGALVGGPTNSDFSTYKDAVNDAVTNEVTTDYNAGMVGATAALYLAYKDSTEDGFSNQTINEDFYGGSNFTLAGEEENDVKPTGVTLDITSQELAVGDTCTLKATVAPKDASQKVKWTSSDTSIATVSSSGVVTAKASGTATITATTVALMESGDAATATCEVKVLKAGELVSDKEALECSALTYGYEEGSSVSASLTNTGEVSITPSSIDFENGDYFVLVKKPETAIEAGKEATIEVKAKTGLGAGTYTDKVIVSYASKTLEIPVSVTVAKKALTIKVNDADRVYGEKNPTFSLDESYEDGLVAGDSIRYTFTTTATEASDVGTYPIEAEIEENANYKVTVQTGVLTINPKGITRINFPVASGLKVGQTLSESTLSEGDTKYGSFAWKDASVEPSKGTKSYDVVLTLSASAIKNYSFEGIEGYDNSKGTVTQAVTVNVTRADLPEVVFPTATNIAYGDTLAASTFVGGSTEYGSFEWEDATYVLTTDDIATGSIQKNVIFTWNEECKKQYSLEADEMTQEQMVTVQVAKQENGEVAATPELASRTASRIVVTETEGVEYSIDGVNWQKSGTFTGLSGFTLYKVYARFEETATHYAGETCATPLQVYTLVANPYNIDVSIFAGENAEQYVEALCTEDGTKTIAYDATKNTLTLLKKDVIYTITGNNKNLVVLVPNSSNSNITLDGATIKKLDLTKTNGDSSVVDEIVIKGTVQVDEIVSDSDNEVFLSGKGTLNGSGIAVVGELQIHGPAVSLKTTGTAITASDVLINTSSVSIDAQTGIVAEENIVIKGYKVTITCDPNGAGLVAGKSVQIEGGSVTVNAGEGCEKSVIVADNIIVSSNSKVTSNVDFEHLYSSTPKDENGNEVVNPEKMKVTKITLSASTKTIKTGESATLTTTVEPANAYDKSVTWTSSNPSVATVDKDGKVTGIAAGVAKITATASDGSSISASCTVTVTSEEQKDSGDDEEQGAIVALEKIKITGATKKVAPGKKLKLKATAYPADATNAKVVWKVNNTKYAKVNSNTGVVTTKKAGRGKKVTVTAYSAEDNSIKATYKISIMKNPVKKIKLSAKTKIIKKGQSVKVKAVFTPTKGISKELTWKSSNKKIATVNSKGKVTGKKKGTVKITAKAKDGSGKKATIRIRVK